MKDVIIEDYLADSNKKSTAVRTVIWYVVSVLIFCLWFNAFYNILLYKSIWPYPDMRKAISVFCLISLPVVVYILLNTLVIFKINRWIKIVVVKVVADVVASCLIVSVANLVFAWIVSLCGKIPVVDWAELFVVDFLILLVHEVAYFIISYRLTESKANRL